MQSTMYSEGQSGCCDKRSQDTRENVRAHTYAQAGICTGTPLSEGPSGPCWHGSLSHFPSHPIILSHALKPHKGTDGIGMAEVGW